MSISGVSISIDTRTLQPGDVYYALRGEVHDGHDYVEAAFAAGAATAVIETGAVARYPARLASRLRLVPDTLRALQEAARAARRGWNGPVIGITGSAGKTTTKEMIAAVLATRLRVLKNEGNLNNHVGLPLTLLRLRPEHQVAVVEMGMNHAGEIARLAEIAEPNIGVFTNVGAAHLGNFDSIEGIAEAKRELARAIPASGTLVLNRDDARVTGFGEGFAGKIVFYSGERRAIPLQYAGGHNQANAAAAEAVGALFAIDDAEARTALAALAPPPGRGQRIEAGGVSLINDCYNANPAAMERMLEVLAATPARRRIAVLGEMRELGAASASLHRRLGEFLSHTPVDTLFAVAGDARHIMEGARAAGFRGEVFFFESAAAAGPALKNYLQPGDVALFKASRAVKLEDAIAALTTDR